MRALAFQGVGHALSADMIDEALAFMAESRLPKDVTGSLQNAYTSERALFLPASLSLIGVSRSVTPLFSAQAKLWLQQRLPVDASSNE